MHSRHSIRCLIFASLLGANLWHAAGDTLSAPEYKIKAAFLYNFAVLTEWPTNAFHSTNAPLVIGVFGKDPFGRILDDTMMGKRIQGRKIKIERFEKTAAITNCHLLFISSSEEPRLQNIFSLLTKRPILTVGEMDRFNFKGGMIWLQKENDEIKFRIRREAVREAGLKLSSKLLALGVNTASRKEEK